MKKIITFIGIVAIAVLTYFVAIKIKDDTMIIKEKDVIEQNTEVESKFVSETAEANLIKIKSSIEKEIGQKIELADTGSIGKIDLCFVVKQDNTYKYIVKKQVDGKDVFAIAEDNFEDAKYIVSLKDLELETLVYTTIDNYNVDKELNITYLKQD